MTLIVQRIATARAGPGTAFCSLAVEARWDGQTMGIAGWRDPPRDLLGRARHQSADLCRRLPPLMAKRLTVEVGRIELPQRPAVHDYVSAFSDLTLLWRGRWSARLPVARLHGERPLAALRGDLPLVLAPSATHGLVLHLLEHPDGAAGTMASAAITVSASDRRPGIGAPSALPRVPGRREACDLLASLERFACPPVVSRIGGRRSLTITARRSAPAPAERLVLEGLEIRGLPGADQVHCRATWTLCAGGRRYSGGEDMNFTLRAGALLADVGACGPRRPAYSADPIEGAFWGWAPPLLLAQRLGELQ